MTEKALIESVTDLLQVAEDASSILGPEIWWRGHSKAEWSLVPGVHRRESPEYEYHISLEFQARAIALRQGLPPLEDRPSWLFIMQHFGLPTRLLDWTRSILVAAYFTVWEKQYSGSDGAIWALNPFAFNKKEFGKPVVLNPRNEAPLMLLKQPFSSSRQPYDKIYAIFGIHIDTRMVVQQGEFTVHGTRRALDDGV